jgi:hypothetical protein
MHCPRLMVFEAIHLDTHTVLMERLNLVLYPGTPEFDVFVPYIGSYYSVPVAWATVLYIAQSPFIRTPLFVLFTTFHDHDSD